MARELGTAPQEQLAKSLANLAQWVELLDRAYDAGYDEGHAEGRRVRERLDDEASDDNPVRAIAELKHPEWDWL